MKKALHWLKACYAGSRIYRLQHSFYPFPVFTWNRDVIGFGIILWLRWQFYLHKPMMTSYVSKDDRYLYEYSSLIKKEDQADYVQTEAYWKRRAAANAKADAARQQVLEENYQAAISAACKK